jgi:ribosomal protein L29
MNKLSKRIKGKKYFDKYYKENKKKGNSPISLGTEEQQKLNELQIAIKEINLVLLDFQFKKATRQPIKPHEIKIAKKQRARLITQYWQIYSGDEICSPLN